MTIGELVLVDNTVFVIVCVRVCMMLSVAFAMPH